MSASGPLDPARQARLEEVLAEYMQRTDRGEIVDREQFLAAHGELADELISYFLAAEQVEQLMAPAVEDVPFLPAFAHPQPIWVDPPLIQRRRVRYVGDYELLEEMAQGGMGVIYRARQLTLRRLVALKMIRAGALASRADVERFRTEAEAAALLDHPHIVPIYEVGEHEGQHYYSMKLIEGGNLVEYLPHLSGNLSAGVQLLATIARAVHHAHQRGVLHRDLKPANILLAKGASGTGGQESEPNDTEDSAARRSRGLGSLVPFVTDFGLAKRLGTDGGLTQPGMIVGTPDYMAPEQASPQSRLSTAVDVYSLGAILFEMLTGRPPFRADTPLATLVQALEQEPPAPRSLRADLDRDLETICLKCLNKDPGQRYGSAEALADDLERWLRHEPVKARPVSAWERGRKWARRNPALAVLIVALILVTFSGLLVTTVLWQQAESQRVRAEDQARAAHRAAYLRGIGLAHAEWQAGNAARATDLLQEWNNDPVRGWEWYYLQRLFQTRHLATLTGHTGGVTAVACVPGGDRIVTASRDRTIRLWDRGTHASLLTLHGHEGPVTALACGPEGRQLASVSTDRTLRLWDLARGEQTLVFDTGTVPLHAVAFSPDGRFVAAGGGESSGGIGITQGELIVWDVANRRVVVQVPQQNLLSAVAFSPDGTLLATAGHDRTVRLWTGPGFRDSHIILVPGAPWSSVSFSPDGKQLAAVSLTGTVKVWDTFTHTEIHDLSSSSPIRFRGLAFGSAPRPYLASGGDSTIHLWHARTGQPAFALRGHARPVTAVAFSPEGRTLLSGSLDATVKLWDTTGRDEHLLFLDHNAPVRALAVSPGGHRLASAGDSMTIILRDLESGEVQRSLSGHTGSVLSVAWSPDGHLLASAGADGVVKVWDPTTGKVVGQVEGHQDGATRVAFALEGGLLATGDGTGILRLCDAATGEVRRDWQARTGSIRDLAFAPGGTTLASAGADGSLTLWNLSDGRPLWTISAHEGGVESLAFAPEGRRLASAGQDDVIRLWDADTGAALGTLEGHTDAVLGVAWGQEQRLASVSRDRTLKVWDTVTGKEFLILRGHTEAIHAVAFSPDNHRLLTASSDRTVKVWDARPVGVAP